MSSHVLTHWPMGDVVVIWNVQFSNAIELFSDWYLEHFNWICHQVNATGPYRWFVNIGCGNGLVPSGIKPLPRPVLTQIYVAIWCHQATRISFFHCLNLFADRFQANTVQYRLIVREVKTLQILNLYTCLDAIQHIEVSGISFSNAFSWIKMYKLRVIFH